MNDPKYHLQVFGGLSAHALGLSTPVLGGQRKRLALAAVVAAHPNGIARDRLLGLFWPESDAARARNALKQLVHGIRRELGDDAILDVNGALVLDGALISSDVQEFHSAIQQGQLARAAGLYRGPFLDGVYLHGVLEFEEWVEKTRRSLELQYSTVLEQLVASATTAGNRAARVRWARALAALDPLSTRTALILIDALSAAGEVATAIKYGELHEALLRHELEVGAPRELREALESLRASHGPLTPPEPRSAPGREHLSADERRSDDREASTPQTRPRRPRRAVWGTAISVSAVATLAISIRSRDVPYSPARPGALVPLTHGQAVETDPAISPDGKWLAFAAPAPGEARAKSNSRIYVRRVDGGSAVPITPDFTGTEAEPRWSPDGGRVAFRTRTGIYIVPALGGTAQLLVADRHRDLHLGNWLSLGDWSHDGLRLAYADTSGIWIRDLARGTDKLVTRTNRFGAHSPTWSPDDANIAYVVGTGSANNVAPSSIWLVSAAGGQAVQLTDGEHLNTAPQFARDGLSIFYVSNRDGARDIYQQRLSRLREEPVVPTRLTTGANAMSISLSADGHHLVYGAVIMRSNVWSAPIMADGATPAAAIRPVTHGIQEVEGLSVSSDGAWLLFDSDRSGNQDIYRMPLSGGEPIQLTADRADDFSPSLSPDGKEIAFYSFRGTGNRRVFTMLSDGARQTPVFEPPANEQEWSPGWRPDGHGLIFFTATTGARHLTLVSRLRDARWGNRRDLYALALEGGRWSPDGRYISATSRDSGLVLLSPEGQLVRVLARSSSAAQPAFAVWGPRAGTVYYRTSGPHEESAFWAISIAAGTPRLLLRLDDAVHTSRRTEFDTDGKRLFFTISTDDANIWKLELLP